MPYSFSDTFNVLKQKKWGATLLCMQSCGRSHGPNRRGWPSCLAGGGAWNLLSKLVPATVDYHFFQSYCHMYLPYTLQEGSEYFTEVSCTIESRDMVGRSSWDDLLFRIVLKEGRYSLTTMVDCCLIDYPFTNITPHTMWMGLGGVDGVSTSCEASIGMVVLQFGDFAPFQAGKSIPATVDCHFSQSHCPRYLPIYITRRFRPFHRGRL